MCLLLIRYLCWSLSDLGLVVLSLTNWNDILDYKYSPSFSPGSAVPLVHTHMNSICPAFIPVLIFPPLQGLRGRTACCVLGLDARCPACRGK